MQFYVNQSKISEIIGGMLLALAVLIFNGQGICDDINSGEYSLIIDNTDVGNGKVFIAVIRHEDISIRDLFGDESVQGMVLNNMGQAIFIVSTDGEQEAIYLDITTSPDNTVNREMLKTFKIMSPFLADLSSDGTKLCFTRTENEESILETYDILTGEREEIFVSKGPISPPAWSPDGKAIAYYLGSPQSLRDDSFKVGVSFREGNSWKHRIVAGPSMLCHRGPSRPRPPMWGLNGKRIIFKARYNESEKGPQIYMVDIEGGNLTHIDRFTGGASDYLGKGVLFSLVEEGVFLYRYDTGKVDKVSGVKGIYEPKPSPKGNLIAYSDPQGMIFIMKSDGTESRKVIDTKRLIPTWRFYWIPK